MTALDALRSERDLVTKEITTLEAHREAIDAAIAALTRTATAAVATTRATPTPRPKLGRRNGLSHDVLLALSSLAHERKVPTTPLKVANWLKAHGKRSESQAVKSSLAQRVGNSMWELAAKGKLDRHGMGLYSLHTPE